MKKIIYTALLLLVTVSCDKWFEAEPQGGGQSGAKVFDNEGSFRDYMNGIYTGLRSAELYGSNLTLGGVEFLAQSFNPYAGAEAWAKMGFNDDMALTIAREAYTRLYAAIYQCNDILRLFAEKKDVDFIAGSREMMVAEARGLRAFLHFELLRLYSPACTVDSGASNILWMEGTQPKGVQMTTAQLTDKIISELEAAAAELAKYDPIVTGVGYDDLSLLGTSPIDRVWKLNYYGCLAAEARALMSRGTAEDFSKAYGLLTKIIGEGGYAFVRTVSGTDYEFSAEFIFALPSPETGFCALSEELFEPAPDGKGVTLSARLDIDDLHADDRRRNWFDSDNTMRTKFAPTSKIDKWKTAPAIPVIKIGEVYLMAAEAAAKSNQLPAGIGQFNDFMVQRNSESLKLPDTATQAQLMEALGKQYQYEFLGEGVRYHFCKRLNLTVTAYDGSQITDVGKKAFPIVK
mgnify:FL=1